MCPDNGIWNYNFVGLGLVPNMKFALILQNPKEFYNEAHRVQHFIKFNKGDSDQ
jgi:pre-mRNA-processing factor 8